MPIRSKRICDYCGESVDTFLTKKANKKLKNGYTIKVSLCIPCIIKLEEKK